MKMALTGASLPIGFKPELYTITFKNGSMLYVTDYDTDLNYRGQCYLSSIFSLERTTITSKIGLEVSTVDVTLYQKQGVTISNLPLGAFGLNGGFDGAHIKIERARQDRVTWLFDGIVTDSAPDREKVKLTISDPRILLNVKMPRNTITPYCSWTLFDSSCGLSKSTFANATSVASGSTSSVLQCSLSQAANYFDLGTIIFTSGANGGATRTVRDYSIGQLVLSKALDHTPAIGDTFIAYPGCDKTLTTCKNVFNNEPNIRIFPYVPTPPASV